MREHLSPEMSMGRLTECVIDQLRDTGLGGGGVGPVYTLQPERGNRLDRPPNGCECGNLSKRKGVCAFAKNNNNKGRM